jgi:hypothetical protein
MKAWQGQIFSCETVSAVGKEIQIATALVNIGELYTDPKKVMDEQSRAFAQQLAENSLRNVHPLTCGNDRGDQAHREYQAIHGGDLGELVKNDNGMECPVCGWKQPPSVQYQIDQLTAENERLTRVVDQAIDCGSLEIVTITEQNKNNFLNGWRNVGKTIIAGIGATERFIAGYPESEPDLYAQLKGADRG